MIPPPLPDDLVEMFRQVCDDADSEAWRIGHGLVDTWAELGAGYIQLFGNKRKAHGWFIGHIAARIGRDPSTLRARERVVLMVGDMRHEHPFTFHQWRALVSAGQKMADYIGWMYREADEKGGGFPSVARIRDKIRSDKTSSPLWVRRLQRLIRAAERLMADEEVPETLRQKLSALVSIMEDGDGLSD